MAIFLKVLGGQPELIEIKVKPILIGRAPGCDVVISSEFSSGQHCIFFLTEGQVTLKDLKSTNGTMLNGELVTNSKVYLGDIVTIGRVEVTLDLESMTGEEIKKHTRVKETTSATVEILEPTKLSALNLKRNEHGFPEDTVTNYEMQEVSKNETEEDKKILIKKSSVVVNNVDFLKDKEEGLGRIHKSGRTTGLELSKSIDARKRELRKNRLKKLQETISVAGVKKLFKLINSKMKK